MSASNPNDDLIHALSLFEKIKGMPVVKRQESLLDQVRKTQVLFAQSLVDTLGTTPDGLTAQEKEYARNNQKIEAIKSIKQRLSCPMHEAEGILKQWQRENNINPYGGQQ